MDTALLALSVSLMVVLGCSMYRRLARKRALLRRLELYSMLAFHGR